MWASGLWEQWWWWWEFIIDYRCHKPAPRPHDENASIGPHETKVWAEGATAYPVVASSKSVSYNDCDLRHLRLGSRPRRQHKNNE